MGLRAGFVEVGDRPLRRSDPRLSHLLDCDGEHHSHRLDHFRGAHRLARHRLQLLCLGGHAHGKARLATTPRSLAPLAVGVATGVRPAPVRRARFGLRRRRRQPRSGRRRRRAQPSVVVRRRHDARLAGARGRPTSARRPRVAPPRFALGLGAEPVSGDVERQEVARAPHLPRHLGPRPRKAARQEGAGPQEEESQRHPGGRRPRAPARNDD
mmetsp:Transcript_9990/g.30322  ORF Transcript_9990/g.30322 Transcript_9990/m.30322 type:complete len:212 (+) Transcript_9990:517-1152(+)